MPFGMTMGAYFRFCAAAMLSMVIGSQIVHDYYKPLKDLNCYIDNEIADLPPDFQQKVRLRMAADAKKTV